MYVAATRARDHLVVSLFHKKRAANGCGAKRLIAAGARDHSKELAVTVGEEKLGRQPLEGLEVDRPAGEEAFKNERSELLSRSSRKRYTSATALIEKEREDETEPWARGRGGTRVGRAVHAAIQSLPWDAGDAEIAAFAKAEAVAEAVPDREPDVVKLVRRALRSAAAMRARSSRALREVPFGGVIGGTTLEGFVDLLIDGPDGLEIVDWKTDQIGESEIDERLERYRLQAGLYVLGIEEATGRRVSRVSYVFTSPDIERSPGDPQELSEKARERLEAGI
jgi:ATP-dependent helicase/nuclease subunit A